MQGLDCNIMKIISHLVSLRNCAHAKGPPSQIGDGHMIFHSIQNMMCSITIALSSKACNFYVFLFSGRIIYTITSSRLRKGICFI